MIRGTNLLLAAALSTLVLGTSVYILVRPLGVGLLPFYSGNAPNLFGAAANWLPSLTHAFAFSIFCAVALGLSQRAVLASCTLWAGLEFAFELGQHPRFFSWLEQGGLGLNYFRYGTFDTADLAASFVGVMSAFALLILIRKAHA